MISESWYAESRTEEDRSEAAVAFIAEVVEVCRRHGFEIGHQDSHGAFQVSRGTDHEWFSCAEEVIWGDT